MADGNAELLTELRDIHLPPLTTVERIGDVLVAFGLGLMIALALGALLRWLAQDRAALEREATETTRNERPLVSMARKAAAKGTALPPELREGLFRPNVDAEAQLGALEAALKRASSSNGAA